VGAALAARQGRHQPGRAALDASIGLIWTVESRSGWSRCASPKAEAVSRWWCVGVEVPSSVGAAVAVPDVELAVQDRCVRAIAESVAGHGGTEIAAGLRRRSTKSEGGVGSIREHHCAGGNQRAYRWRECECPDATVRRTDLRSHLVPLYQRRSRATAINSAALWPRPEEAIDWYRHPVDGVKRLL
jgi:hypothetical protein